ncbi:MAG: serine/threonine-protein kinase, partial [Rubrobacteraceae bacterium]
MQRDLVDERYSVLGTLGGGGMGQVYLARDELLGREVALKVLRPQHAENQDFVERFRREAKNAAALSHPNIV